MSLSVSPRPTGCKDFCSPEDIDVCRSRLSEYASFWIKTGNAPRLINMMKSVQCEVLFEDAALGIHCLTALAYEQQFEQADRFLENWLIHLRGHSHIAPDTFAYLQTNLASVVVLLETLRGDLSLLSEEKIHHLKQALAVPSEHQAMLNNIFAYLLYMNGKYAKAQQFAARAYHFSIQNEDWFSRSISVLLQCVCDRAQGRFEIAYKSVMVAMQSYEVVNDSPAWAVLALVRAMFEYETNRLDVAENLLQKARPRLTLSAISDFRVNANVTLARVHTSQENYLAAEQVLSELQDVVSQGNDRRWMDYIAHERLRVGTLAGKQGLYLHWRELSANDEGDACEALRTKYCPAVGHVPERTLLMLALQEGDLEAAERALGHLGKICSLQADSFLRVVVLSGSAALEFGRNNHDQAIVFLNQALTLCKHSQLYRALFDENFSFGEVFALAAARADFDEDVDAELLQKLSAERFPTPRRSQDNVIRLTPLQVTPLDGCVETLTDTEIKVLDLLSQGLSNKDISRRLGIAVTTTKWHLKNIFGKLATTNRVSAVIRARELQLLSVVGQVANSVPAGWIKQLF